MIEGYADPDAAANLLERRWFSSIAAVRTAQAECEVLREVMELAEGAWREARVRLAEFEILRDTLGEQLDALDGPRVEDGSQAAPRGAARRLVLSAA
jgi:hypothetical protein